MYHQKKLANQDLSKLKQIFDRKNVYDFSGINEITEDYRNYYETAHYRPHIARLILEEVYSH